MFIFVLIVAKCNVNRVMTSSKWIDEVCINSSKV